MYKENEELIKNHLISINNHLSDIFTLLPNTSRDKDEQDFYLKNVFDYNENDLITIHKLLNKVINNINN